MQISKGKRHSPQWFTDAWPRSLFIHHILAGRDDVASVEAKRKIGGVEDKLISFLQTEGLSFPSEADAVKRHCEKVSLKDVEDGVGEAGTRKASWIDDRNTEDLDAVDVGGNSRQCRNWLTATELLKYLKEPVWPTRVPSSLVVQSLTHASDTTVRRSLTRSDVFCKNFSSTIFVCTSNCDVGASPT